MKKERRFSGKRMTGFFAALTLMLALIPTTLAAAYPSIGPLDFEDQQLHGAGPREFGETVAVAANPDNTGVNTSSYAIKVSNRSVGTTDPYAGVKFDISNFIDTRVTVTAKVYMDGGTNASIKANIQQVAGGASQYATIVSSPSGKGTWYEITGSFDIPAYLDEAYLYFETSATTNDFYVDDVSVVGSESQLKYVDYSNLPSLKDLYSDYFKIGVGTPYALVKSTDHSGLIKQQYNSLTNENEAKPENLIDISACIADPAKYNESPAVKFDTITKTLDFCKANNLKYRLHTLVWHSQTPSALFHEDYDVAKPFVSRELMEKRLENYIKQILQWCGKNYPGVVYAVDVVNEAVDIGVNSNWYKVFGSYDYVTKAFEYARKYAPADMKLYYNDYNTYNASKQQKIINLLRNAKAAGTIDGVGMQGHLSSSTNMADFVNALKIYSDLGYDVQVTELDITLSGSGTTDEKFVSQAAAYRDLFQNLVDAKKAGANISSVTIWAVSDNFSWKNYSPPVLFNADLSAKPAFTALAELGAEVKFDATLIKLEELVAKTEKMDLSGYTDESVAALKTALTAAKAVLKGEGATQADLDKAIDDIGRAVGKLELLPEEAKPEEPKPDTPKEPVKTGDGFMAAGVAAASVIFVLTGGAALFLKKRKHI